MAVHINEVLEYLDTHLVCHRAEGMESLMETLHDVYLLHSRNDREALQEGFEKLRQVLNLLPTEKPDAMFELVADLCLEHEQLAFSQGVLTGMMLMTEVNRIP